MARHTFWVRIVGDLLKRLKANLFDLSTIDNLAKYLEDYRNDLPRKCETIVYRLKEIGILIAQANIDSSPLGNTIKLQCVTQPKLNRIETIIIATGTTFDSNGRPFNSLLGVEFGAGIHYNRNNDNPLAPVYGMGVGSFPNQTHALQEGWAYKGEDGEMHFSHGVKATMPMFKASQAMENMALQIIKEVFAYG